MSDILAFLEIDRFISNINNTVSVVGELATTSKTYSRDVKIYTNDSSTLHVFDEQSISDEELAVVDLVSNEVLDGLVNIPSNLGGDGILVNKVRELMPDIFTNVTVGRPVVNPVDLINYPEWIQLTVNSNGYLWTYKVWLVNSSFALEYPAVELEVVTPIDNIQNLYDDFTVAANAIQAMRMTTLAERQSNQVTVAVTGVKVITVTAYNHNNSAESVDVPFLIAFNGSREYVTAELMLRAIEKILLAGGSHPLSEWAITIPELLPVNVFTIIPTWDNVAVDSPALSAPIYTPTLSNIDKPELLRTYLPTAELENTIPFVEYSVSIYKSLGFYSIPSSANTDGRLTWLIKYPDYMVLAINDPNINQLNNDTQNIIVLLNQLLPVAESYVAGASISAAYALEERDNRTFVTGRTGNVKLAIMTRDSYLGD